MTRLELRSRNKESLVDMARRRKIAGASKMTRDELITRLLASAPVKTVAPSAQAAKPAPPAAAQMKSSPAKTVAASSKPKKTTKTVKAPLQRQVARDTTNEAARVNGGIMSSAAFQPRHGVAASPSDLPRSYGRDRLVLLVRDPFWLHCYWEISSQTTRLAEAALGVRFGWSVLAARKAHRVPSPSLRTSPFLMNLTIGTSMCLDRVGVIRLKLVSKRQQADFIPWPVQTLYAPLNQS
jgi:hypothetical protein